MTERREDAPQPLKAASKAWLDALRTGDQTDLLAAEAMLTREIAKAMGLPPTSH